MKISYDGSEIDNTNDLPNDYQPQTDEYIESETYEPSDYVQYNKNTNGVALICKRTAIVIFIFGFIIGILASNATSRYSINFSIMGYFWGGSYISGLLFYAIGEIISLLSRTNENFEDMNQQNENWFFEQLRELAGLKEEGILTEEEFIEKKKELLNKF